MPYVMDPDRMEAIRRFGANLRVARIKKVLTMEDLAERVGCLGRTVARIEEGRSYTSDAMLDALAFAVGMTRKRLMGDPIPLPERLPPGVLRCPYGCGGVFVGAKATGGHAGACERNPRLRQGHLFSDPPATSAVTAADVQAAPSSALAVLSMPPEQAKAEIKKAIEEVMPPPPPEGPIVGGLLPTPSIEPLAPPPSDPFAASTPGYMTLLRLAAGLISVDDAARLLRQALRI